MSLGFLVVLFVVAVVFGFFSFIVFPLWTLIDCLKHKELPTQGKILWVIALFLFCPFASIGYAFIAQEKLLLKKLAGMSVLATLSIFTLAVVFALFFMPRQFDETLVQLEQLESTHLNKVELINLKHQIKTLQLDSQGSWAQMEKKIVSWDLLELMEFYLSDQKLSPEEYRDFSGKFENRQNLNPKILKREVKRIKRNGLTSAP
jgi:hypothetical protein